MCKVVRAGSRSKLVCDYSECNIFNVRRDSYSAHGGSAGHWNAAFVSMKPNLWLSLAD